MSEPPPTEPQRIYTCPNCHNEIAPLFDHPDYPVALLNCAGMIVTDARGLCKQCGEVVHFHTNTEMLQKLLRAQGVEVSEQELNQPSADDGIGSKMSGMSGPSR